MKNFLIINYSLIYLFKKKDIFHIRFIINYLKQKKRIIWSLSFNLLIYLFIGGGSSFISSKMYLLIYQYQLLKQKLSINNVKSRSKLYIPQMGM
jgi:hypothetical protein